MSGLGRPAVEVLLGNGGDAAVGIEGDFALLLGGAGAISTRVWACESTAVVLGASRAVAIEVDCDECERLGVAVLRRASGGGTVMIGPGTVQYALVFPHSATAAPSLDAVKEFSSRLVGQALMEAGLDSPIESDPSGDLRLGSRKVAGVALRRRRDATLLHGTMLVGADLARIARVLHHPELEPAWRGGRSHLDFLDNLGLLDVAAFEQALARGVAQSGAPRSL